MKFECGKRSRLRFERLTRWHRWFALHPVKLGKEDCRWLETVERRWVPYRTFFLTPPYGCWEYRNVSR